MKYSIIIPIFKEKKNLTKLIKILTHKLKVSKIIYEIILIDDDSRDGTKEIFSKIKSKNTKLYIRNKKQSVCMFCILYKCVINDKL